MFKRNVCIPASYLILKKDDKILMLKRKNTGYEDGNYSFIAGHVEKNESFTTCAIREAREEAGIKVNKEDLHLVHIMYRKEIETGKPERLDTFYEVSVWEGDISNLEPEKCAELKWFKKSNIPKNTIPYIRKTLEYINIGINFSEYGWSEDEI